jgi:hypothetical protein
MESLEVQDVMRQLARVRPIFHSEADFQHAIAWELHQRHTDASIRLERRMLPDIHLDLSVSIDGLTTAIELKYKTRALEVTVDGERFELRQHGAQPPNRYDMVNDLVRIERILAEGVAHDGFVVVLTNDTSYWQEGHEDGGVGAAFRIHDGRLLAGTLAWGSATAPATMHNRKAALTLTGRYETEWRDYSRFSSANGTFRYLAINVRSSNR